MEKLKLKYPVIVEGKYDKITLSSVVSSSVIVLNGFSVFKDEEKRALIKKLCPSGAILLTDSDRAGAFIRSKLKGYFKDIVLYNIYTPQIKGREKRKKKDSAEGYLGVEGIDAGELYRLLMPFKEDGAEPSNKKTYTKKDFMIMGLSGEENSRQKREELANKLGLPAGMTANALLEAINILGIELPVQ